MDGQIKEGWYRHPQLGLINVFRNTKNFWVYQCYSDNGSRLLSKEREVDQWTWALCQAKED